MREPLRLIDLVPRRLITFGLLLLIALGVVAGLEGLYAWTSTPGVNQITTDGTIAAFDLDGEGSLAVWFSSAILMLAALVAVLVYTIRRHKTDDYRGNYRVWLWAALCWTVMSIDETSSLHEGFMGMMTHVTGTKIYGDGSVWWVVPYFFLLGAVGSRLLVDMRRCRLSSLALLTTAGCYATAVATQVAADGLSRAVMIEEGAEMVGNVFLLLAMGLHARYVILDAEGLLPARQPSRDELEDEQAEEESASAAAEWLSVDSPHATPRPVLKRRARTVETEPVQSPVGRKLTKQEKKALRKRLMQERLKRERQQRDGW
ncbi:MAG: hypothetical protein ACYSWU_25875 [Planctomycetota bacterium]